MLPAPGALDTRGLNVPEADVAALLAVDSAAWVQEATAIEEHYARFGAKLPRQLAARLAQLKAGVAGA